MSLSRLALAVTAALVSVFLASPAHAADIRPASAIGHNGHVEILVNGSGTHVNYVQAQAWIDFTGHFRIYDDIAGWSMADYNQFWYGINDDGSPQPTTWQIQVNDTEPKGSKICAEAYSTSGKSLGNACETIE